MNFLAELAWLGSERGVESDVLIVVAGDRIESVEPGRADAGGGCERLAGLTMPGLVNAHSHAFHRAIRGWSETRSGNFWTWRELMYEVAGRLEPDLYLELATAVYAEMALAGFTAVGEFHYVHHDRQGSPYADPNEMGLALVEAARRAGVRITLIDTCYLRGGLDGRRLEGAQIRFDDHSGEAWAGRVDELRNGIRAADDTARVAVAIHSVRAVATAAMETVATYAARNRLPLHFHLSEQQRENEECLAEEGCSPTELLQRAGAVTPHSTAVHATHLLPRDITQLGLAGASICACPTTERDLADGVGPFADLVDAGAALCIGTDSHASIDPFEELRGIELNERLVTNERGIHLPASLLSAGTAGGAQAIGWPEAGKIAAGALADLVTLRLDSPRLAGGGRSGAALEAGMVFAAGAGDVSRVMVGGRTVVEDGRHLAIGDVGGALASSIGRALGAK